MSEIEHIMAAIDELGDRCHKISKDHGFWPVHLDGSANVAARNFGEMLALIHSEVSEALENYREGEAPDKHLPQYTGWHVELADIIIRTIELARAHRIPIGEIIFAKMDFNEEREHKHGKRY